MMPELIFPTGVVLATVLWWALCRGAEQWNPPPAEPPHQLSWEHGADAYNSNPSEESEKEGL